MSFIENFKKPPEIRPSLNIGALFDIPTGAFKDGKDGEKILNGGMSFITGIVVRGNTHKSTLAHYGILTALDRYENASGSIYDTEISLTYTRLDMLSTKTKNFSNGELIDSPRFRLTDKTIYSGEEWFGMIQDNATEVKKNRKKLLRKTPFIDRKGEYIEALDPLLMEVDSFSQLETANIEAMFDKNDIGSSGLNVEALKGGGAKSQLMTRLPSLTNSSGTYITLTAHLGDEFIMDKYATSTKKLAFIKGNIKFKRVPENFTFLTNNLWLVTGVSVLMDTSTKKPKYPMNKEDNRVGNTDLMVIHLINTRAKSGPSGLPINVVVSQRLGVQPSLSEFLNIKDSKEHQIGYGLSGNMQTYHLDILPDVNLSRTTIRSKIDESYKLRRALNITSELYQMTTMRIGITPEIECTPLELYEDLKAMGYDWDILLETRGYWIFNDQKSDRDYLSTLSLLEMRVGKYKPKWYKGKISAPKEKK